MLRATPGAPACGQHDGAHRRGRGRRVLVVQTDRHGPQVVWIGAWTEPLGICLVADRLSALMLLVSAVVTLAVLVYSIGQGMTGDERETPRRSRSTTRRSWCSSAGVSNAFLAGDLFNLFVSFEMLLFASYVLLTLGGTARADPGRARSTSSSTCSPRRCSSSRSPRSTPPPAASTSPSSPAGSATCPTRVSLMLQLLLLTTFSIKAAVFPLSFWLPDSYPTAPAPVTAVFAGLLTKVGVYAIIRTQTLLFPDSPLTDLLLWAALLTMVVGILGAVAQSDIKRMLSFTLVSHIGYMMFGIALATEAGLLRRDLLRRAPHHHPDRAVPGARARRTTRRQHEPDQARRPGPPGAAAGRPVLRARHEPRRHPADVGLPRQGRRSPRPASRSAPRWRTPWSRRAWSPAC